jgi:hypothetical protein
MPTDRQLNRLLLGSRGGSAPSGGYGGSDITQLILEQGRQRADAALRSGEMWGGALQQVGQQIGGAIQQHAEQKQMAKRDAAWAGLLQDPMTWKDPKAAYARTMSMWGPEKGPQMWQGLVGVMQLSGEKRDPERDAKALGAAGAAYLNSPPEGRRLQYPGLRALAGRAAPEYTQALPEEYDPAVDDSVVLPFVKQYAPKPESYTLSPGQSRFENGQQVAAVPPEEKAQPGFSLGPGETRFDASGQQIASRPAAPREPRVDNEPLVPVIGDDGQPVLMRRSQAAGRRPASNREQGRPVISGDANRIAKLGTSLDRLGALEGQISGSGATGAKAKLGVMVPDFVTEFTGIGGDAKSKQAAIDLVRQNVGKALEEGVLRKEDEEKYKRILPKIEDPPEVVRAKFRELRDTIEQDRANLLDSLGDAGYDVGAFQSRVSGQGKGAKSDPLGLR